MRPTATTDRLLEALDVLADEAAAPLAAGDWQEFAALLERESAVVAGLVAQTEQSSDGVDGAAVRARVAALLKRYEARAQQLGAMVATTQAELRELRGVRRQLQAVRSVYRRRH